jgi:uncharacterized metal-binding protein
LCEGYTKKNTEKEYAILSCEGACLRGEISRQVANIICHELSAKKTVRICLGGAFTKDTGQRALVRNAKKILALEGCFTDCASRTMRAVLPEIKPIIIETDKLAVFDKSLFGIDEIEHDEIIKAAKSVAKSINEKYII